MESTEIADEIIAMRDSLKKQIQKARVRKGTLAAASTDVVDVELKRLLKEFLRSLRDLGIYRPHRSPSRSLDINR